MSQRIGRWPVVTLSELVRLDRQAISPQAITPGTLYVGLEHIDGDVASLTPVTLSGGDIASAKYRFDRRHVLYGKLRPNLRKIACPGFDGVCSTDILPLLPNELADRRFLYYYLRKDDVVRLAVSRCTGANLPRLNPRDLLSFEVPLPPLNEQRRIAALLDTTAQIRRDSHDALGLIGEFVRATFLDMFGDPVTNPRTWPVKALGEALSEPPRIGTTCPASARGVQTVVRVGDLGGTWVEVDSAATVTLDPQASERFALAPGDIVLARAIGSKDHLGKASLIANDQAGLVFDSHVMRLRVLRSLLTPEFLLAWLKSKGGRHLFLKNAARTAVQYNINSRQLTSIQIPIPPRPLQERFSKICRETWSMQELRLRGIQSANELFQALIHQTLSVVS